MKLSYLLLLLPLGLLAQKKNLSKTIQTLAPPTLVSNTPDAATRLKNFEAHLKLKQESPYTAQKWRFIGPDNISVRITDVAVPTQHNGRTIYAGSATGGLWKTDNGGISWRAIMDEAATQSIGNLGIAPSNPQILYVGTGEANIFRASRAGTGIYKTTDGGSTFKHIGLENTSTIARIVVHPTNPDVLYVAATGNEWSYNPDRGVYKSTDGGKTWEKVFYLNEKTGAIDLVIDPTNPQTLYASMWNRIRRRWSDPIPEDGDGIYKTTDGGKTWNILTVGLPDTKTTGRVGLAISKSNPNVLYASIDNHGKARDPKPGELDSYLRPKEKVIFGAEVYRSENKGESWAKVSPTDAFFEQFSGTYGWVFSQIRIDPQDENTLYLLGRDAAVSRDGGKTWKEINGFHGDNHALWINPTDSQHLVWGDDGGCHESFDGGQKWRSFYEQIPANQLYTLGYDMATPFNVYTSVQDWGTYRGNVNHKPSQKTAYFDVNDTHWEACPGGEGTFNVIDPTNPNIYYSSVYYGMLTRTDFSKKPIREKNIMPKTTTDEPTLRGEWLAPTLLSPHNNKVLYHGLQYVYRSMNQGDSWERISPDLSNFNAAEQGILPYRITFACLTALTESPKKFGLLYTGTDDGRVHVTQNSGITWNEISTGIAYKKHTSRLVASAHNEATVYCTQNGRRDDDHTAYLWKSDDYGKTWTSLKGNLPDSPVNVIREDDRNHKILYVGTDLGVYISKDSGASWSCLSNNLPNCVYVDDLFVHPQDPKMVIATYGRGMWVLDGIGKIRE